MNTNIPKVAIIGGPCSGKTTGLSLSRTRFLELGFIPIIVPEAATTVFGAGLNPKLVNDPIEIQKMLLEFQFKNENFFLNYAMKLLHQGKKPILLLDRGVLDGKAYVSPDQWLVVLDELHHHESDFLTRYSNVIHLDTAPEAFYTTDNNPERFEETFQEAWTQNEKTKNAHVGVEHFQIVTNRGDFKVKMHDFETAILDAIGYPEPLEKEVAFDVLSTSFTPSQIPIQHSRSEIIQQYLLSEKLGWVERVRKRTFEGNVIVYTHTFKNRETLVEKQVDITLREYLQLLNRRDPQKVIVKKNRYCFLWENQYFELDEFIEPNKGKLRLELEGNFDSIKIPHWIGKVKETNVPNEVIASLG